MLKIIKENITSLRDIDVIVNAANGVGIMGAGVAGAISRSGGDLIKKAVAEVCSSHGKPFECGEIYSSDPGLLKRMGFKAVYHAVVMKFPGSPTSIKIVQDLCHNIIQKTLRENYKSIAIPGLGTGIGKLDKKDTARNMVNILKQYDNQIDIYLTDLDDSFIRYAEDYLLKK